MINNTNRDRISRWCGFTLILALWVFPFLFPSTPGAKLTTSSPSTIRVVMDDDYPPYIFKDTEGHLRGILPDQWRLWEEKSGIHVELTATDWAEAQHRMQAGEFDVIDTIFRNDQRDKIYEFSAPYADLQVPITFRSEISGIHSVRDLRGFIIAVKSGDTCIDVLRSHNVAGNLIEFDNYEEIVAAARDHKVNVFVIDRPPANYYLYKFGINDQFRETKPLFTGQFHRAVLEGNRALLKTVEKGFARISKAEYNEIKKRWYGSPIVGKSLLRYLWMGITVLAVVFSGLFFWVWILRSLVAQRTAALEKEIEARIEQEELLRKSEHRFRTIFDNSNEALFIHELPSGNIIDVNQTMCKMYGYTHEEAINPDIAQLGSGVPPYTRNDALRWVRKAMAGEPQQFEWHTRDKNGRLFWVEVKMRHITIDDEERVVVTVRDIDERKKSEKLLLASEARYRELVEGTSDLVTQTDAAGRFLYVNHNAETFFGCPAELCVGRSAFDFVHPEDMAKTRAAFQNWVQSGTGSITFENRQVSLSGDVHDMLWTINPHTNVNGIVEVNSIGRDISEQRKLQKEQLKNQKLESLGVLAGGIAHDFNNILTGILGNISLARMSFDQSHEASKILLRAERASKLATNLSHQLLTFAKGSRPIKKLVSATQIVESSTSLVLSGSNVLSVIDIPGQLYDLEVDEGQISQVFNNIIINAAQVMPGGGSIVIKAENIHLEKANSMALAPGDYVGFTLTDTGCGISEENLKKIFDPYFTTKVSGNGLGLASAHSIISKHGGHIDVRSQVGVGTTFEILLPASKRKILNSRSQTTVLKKTDHSGCRILVMDDEEIIRELVTNMLQEVGCEVEKCSDGTEAIASYQAAMLAGKPFTAVIMDLTIPNGMGGREAAGHILDLDPLAGLIVSSGYANDPIMADPSQFGFRASLVKPYNFEEISQVVRQIQIRPQAAATEKQQAAGRL